MAKKLVPAELRPPYSLGGESPYNSSLRSARIHGKFVRVQVPGNNDALINMGIQNLGPFLDFYVDPDPTQPDPLPSSIWSVNVGANPDIQRLSIISGSYNGGDRALIQLESGSTADTSKIILDAEEIYIDDGSSEILFSGWSDWTPTYGGGGITPGTGATVVARHAQLGKLVIAKYQLTLGTSPAVGSSPTISLPVEAANVAANERVGWASFSDANGTDFYGTCFLTTTTMTPFVFNAAATHLTVNPVTATVPFTWVATDQLFVTVIYEAA